MMRSRRGYRPRKASTSCFIAARLFKDQRAAGGDVVPACASVRSDQMVGLRLAAEKAADPFLDCTIRLGYALVLAQMLEP